MRRESSTRILLLLISSLTHAILALQVTADYMQFDALLQKLEGELRASCDTGMASARMQLEGGLVDLARERTKGLAEVDEERAKGLGSPRKKPTCTGRSRPSRSSKGHRKDALC
jgi:two-component sensor histidine kinase